jgi:hypothetical protein
LNFKKALLHSLAHEEALFSNTNKKQEEMLDAMSERNGMCVPEEYLPQSRAVL